MSLESDDQSGSVSPPIWMQELKRAADEPGIPAMLHQNPRKGAWRLDAPGSTDVGLTFDEGLQICQKAIDNGRLAGGDLEEVNRQLAIYLARA